MKNICSLLLMVGMLFNLCVFVNATGTKPTLDIEILFSKTELEVEETFDVTLSVTNKNVDEIHCGSFSFIYDNDVVEFVEEKSIENWELTTIHYEEDGEILLLAELNSDDGTATGIKNGETINFTFTFKATKFGNPVFKAQYIDFALYNSVSKKITGVFVEDLENSMKILGFPASLKGVSLQVGSGIELCFTGFIPEGYEGAKIHFEQSQIDNENIDNFSGDVEGADKGNGLYDFLMPIHPARLGDKVEAYLVLDGEQISDKVSYSVLDYCNYVFNNGKSSINENATDEQYEIIVALLSDLLEYGKEAQVYTNYNTDKLVTGGVTKVEAFTPSNFTTIDESEDDFKISGTASKVDFSTVTMTFNNNFWLTYGIEADSIEGMKMLVRVNTGKERYYCELDSASLVKSDEDRLYYLNIKPAATGIDYIYTVTLFDAEGNEGRTLRFSAKAYVYSTQNTDGYSAFSQSLYNYGKSIENYVNVMEGK